MTRDKWDSIVYKLETMFPDAEVIREDIEDVDTGIRETVEFESPQMGLIKLEFIDMPLLLEERTIGGKRIGATVKVEKIYSDTERVYRLNIYKKNSLDEWEKLEIETEDFVL